MDPNMKLSENFTLREYTKSQTAARRGIDNRLPESRLNNAITLFENVVQPVRNHFGPTIVTSGYRSEALNSVIGGSPRSQHKLAQAVDIEVPGTPTGEVAEWISNNVGSFDQLILEYYDPSDVNSGWVHVSYVSKGHNRKEVMTASKVNGTTEYSWGLNY
jgi:hypothetical protein